MNSIRFAQYAILTTAAVLIVCYFAITSAGYLVLVTLLGFGQDSNLGELIAADPAAPTIIAVALCCFFALEAVRVCLRQKKIPSS